MAKRSALHMTAAAVAEHQRRHGFAPLSDDPNYRAALKAAASKPRMNKTETEYSLILEARKRRSEIVEWKFEGISLSWGIDPETKKPMWYTPDFYVVTEFERVVDVHEPTGIGRDLRDGRLRATVIEVKGGHIFEKDRIRFKGCRAEWPMFQFEMWQKKGGEWRRIH